MFSSLLVPGSPGRPSRQPHLAQRCEASQVYLFRRRKATLLRPLVARWGTSSEKSGNPELPSVGRKPQGVVLGCRISRELSLVLRAFGGGGGEGFCPSDHCSSLSTCELSPKAKSKLPFFQESSSGSFQGVSLSNSSFLAYLFIFCPYLIKTYYILRNHPPSPQRSLSTGSI